MATTVSPYDPELTQEEIGLSRRQALAAALQQQASTPLGPTEMVSGRAVKRSPMEGLAKMFQAYQAAKIGGEADRTAQELAVRNNQIKSQKLAEGLRLLKGQEGQPEIEAPSAELGGGPGREAVPGVAPNPEGAIVAFNAHPSLQPYAASLVANLLKGQDPYSLRPGETRYGPGNKPVATNTAIPKTETINGEVYEVVPGKGLVKLGGPGQVLSPADIYRQQQENMRYFGVSGNTAATQAGEDKRFAGVSGNTAANNRVTMRGQDISADIPLQSALAQGKAAGTTTGTAQAQGAIDLPKAVASAKETDYLIKNLIGDAQVDAKGNIVIPKDGAKPHPGFSSAVGANITPGAEYIPGSSTAGAVSLHNQLTSKAFLEAYQNVLKGGGSITEIEGAKGTAALLRAQRATSEAEYIKSVREFQQHYNNAIQAKQQFLSGGSQAQQGQPSTVLRFDQNGNQIP